MKLALAVVSLLALAACSAPADAPVKPGVCWIEAPPEAAKLGFAVLSVGDNNLETCAMHLELTSISGHKPNLLGAYQGQYIFVTRDKIASSDTLTGQRFSLFTPGQRADVDAQIIDLLKTSKTPSAQPDHAKPNPAKPGATQVVAP